MTYTTVSVKKQLRAWWWAASLLAHVGLGVVATVAPSPQVPVTRREVLLFDSVSLPHERTDHAASIDTSDAGALRASAQSATPSPQNVSEIAGNHNAQNVDSRERGERGDGRSAQQTQDMISRTDRIEASRELQNHVDLAQVGRIRTARERASWQDERRTPTPGDDAHVGLQAGELWIRVRPAPARPAVGRDTAQTQSTQARAGAQPQSAILPGETQRVREWVAPGSVAQSARGASTAAGSDRTPRGQTALAHVNHVEGHASTPSETLAERPSDTTDALALARSLAQSALTASPHGGVERANGGGGVGGGGAAGSGGGVGEGGHARAVSDGDGWLSLSSPEPRYRRYFLALRRVLVRLTRDAFPQRAALDLEQGTVIVELRIEPDGRIAVTRFARRSGIDGFDRNVARALDGAMGPAIPPDVSQGPMRVRYERRESNPIVR
ncbi:MAG: TonB family protein [Deltaproteobacteria bacterium]|nr:TonB family protein [Deltaproteobacteria bacterium]